MNEISKTSPLGKNGTVVSVIGSPFIPILIKARVAQLPVALYDPKYDTPSHS